MRSSANAPTRGYAHIVNADPVSGEPAILGEIAADSANLTNFKGRWRTLDVLPLERLRELRPLLYQALVSVTAGATTPRRWRVCFNGDHATLVHQQPLSLPPASMLNFLYALLRAGTIQAETFLARLPSAALSSGTAYLDPTRNQHLRQVTTGTPISGGPFTGVLVHDASAPFNEKSIVVVDRIEANHTVLFHDPNCTGVIALRGSAADHFAIMAREREFPYLVLAEHTLDADGLHKGDLLIPYGSFLTVDTTDGRLFFGSGVIDRTRSDPATTEAVRLLAAHKSPIPLRMNIDHVDDLTEGLLAEVHGIGLLRTEHLLRRGGQNDVLRAYLETGDERALTRLGEFFQNELTRCLQLAGGRPVTVRLLDYPLHELGGRLAREVNPMLGLRGVRQGLRWPRLYITQIDALIRAALEIRRQGLPLADLEIMVPMIVSPAELRAVRRMVDDCCASVSAAALPHVRFGAMIETPAAALAIEALAAECDFLSFGTNDLTQLTLGLSREDYEPVLRAYVRAGLDADDPYEAFHPTVLGLVRDAAARARQAQPALTIGLCGAHAADVAAIELCAAGTLDYLSVAGRLVPIAKLRAIQSAARA